MNKIKVVRFMSQILWPCYRAIWAKSKVSKRCQKCLISDKHSPLDKNYICQKCKTFTHQSEENTTNKKEFSGNNENLMNLIKSHIHVGQNNYDALVLFSGGKDSTMLIHKLISEIPGLRFLAVTINNGFMSPYAIQNIKDIVQKFSFDHVFLQPGNKVFERAFKYAFENVNGKGCTNYVDMIDGDLFHDIAFHFASKLNIPLVMSGLSREQVEDIIKINSFELPESFLEQKRLHSGEMEIAQFTLKNDYDSYWWSPESYDCLPKVIFPNSVWNYTEEQIYEVISQKCGLSSERLDPLLTNNDLIPIMAVVDYRQMGYSSFEPEFSKMARAGKIDLKTWRNTFEFFEYLSLHTSAFDKEIKNIFSKLEVNANKVFHCE